MIVENDECLADRGQQCMAQSSTITRKDDSVTQKSALNDLNFKPKSTLLVKYYIFFKDLFAKERDSVSVSEW